MTAYSNIINKTVEDAMSSDGFDAKAFAPKVYSKISAMDRKRTSINSISQDLRRAANDIAKRAMKARESRQMGFSFMLIPGAVAVDDDGHKVKFTMSLLRLEFQRATALRRKNQEAAGDIADEMENAERLVSRYWDAHPSWTFGQCLDQLAADSEAGAQ